MGNEEQGHCLKAVSVASPPSKEGGGEIATSPETP